MIIDLRSFFLFFTNLFILFIYFWMHWVFVAVHGLSLVVASGGYSSLWCTGISLQWLLLLQSTGSRHTGFSSCGVWAQWLWLVGSRAQPQQLWHMGLVAPLACGIFLDQGSNPCSLHWQVDSLPLHPQGSPLSSFLMYEFIIVIFPLNTDSASFHSSGPLCF